MVDPGAVAGGVLHPGEHICDGLDETGTTAYALAKAMRVPGDRLLAILAGRCAITADSAIRIGAATGTSAEIWLGPQSVYDLEVALDGRSVRQPISPSPTAWRIPRVRADPGPGSSGQLQVGVVLRLELIAHDADERLLSPEAVEGGLRDRSRPP